VKQQIRFCIARDGARLAYATTGRGRPLVKAANWLTHIEHDLHNPIWQPFLARLAAGRMLVRYDQRACGLSDWKVDDISFEAWAADLVSVVDSAKLKRFALLGISQGGAVAVRYAARHPERVSHLVLLGAYARGSLRRDPAPDHAEALQALIRLVRYGWGGGSPTFRHLFSLQFLPHGSAEQLRLFDDLQRISASPENAARTLSGFDEIDIQDVLPQVSVPTLVLHARQDARIPFEEGRSLAASIPGACFVPLASANHIPLHGEPAFEEMMVAIDAFLAADSAVDEPPTLTDLTRRERDILHLLARGLANAAIAEQLSISVKTVRNHVSNIFDKLGVNDRAQAIVHAREAGFGRDKALPES
jgi:pimeloyl-ACP methyl ester carboxylesterase/DNA-binding CsgD family transcriptional regulator